MGSLITLAGIFVGIIAIGIVVIWMRRRQRVSRYKALRGALELAQKLQKVEPEDFASTLSYGNVPHPAGDYVKLLAGYKAYLDEIDVECYQHVAYLRSMIEKVERKASVAESSRLIQNTLKTLQDRLGVGPVESWRAEVSR